MPSCKQSLKLKLNKYTTTIKYETCMWRDNIYTRLEMELQKYALRWTTTKRETWIDIYILIQLILNFGQNIVEVGFLGKIHDARKCAGYPLLMTSKLRQWIILYYMDAARYYKEQALILSMYLDDAIHCKICTIMPRKACYLYNTY